jgi:hypothetical protein
VLTNPSTPPKTLNLKPPSSFQPVPPIVVVAKVIKPSTFGIQDLDLVMSDRIVQHPWDQSPPQLLLSMDNLMDAT